MKEKKKERNSWRKIKQRDKRRKNESWETKKDKCLCKGYKNMDKVNKKQMRKL